MALSDFNARTVYGTYTASDGVIVKTFLEFYPNTVLQNAGDTLTQEPVRVDLDTNGYFEVPLLCTDKEPGDMDPTTVPFFSSGWAWTCRDPLGRKFWFLLYGNADGVNQPQALGNITPIPRPPPIIGVTQGADGEKGPEGEKGVPFNVYVSPMPPQLTAEDAGDLWFSEVEVIVP